MALTSQKRAKSQQNAGSKSDPVSSGPEFHEGDRLTSLLKAIRTGIELARAEDGDSLPEKIWLKQLFAIGVNDVTRVLERMKSCMDSGGAPQNRNAFHKNPKAPAVQLQAILLAGDCNPRMLTKHLPALAASRKVPVFLVRDKKQGSLRLGELVKLKTAIAIGIKERRSAVNRTLEGLVEGSKTELEPDPAAEEQVE